MAGKSMLLAACAVALCASAVATSRGLLWNNWGAAQEHPVASCSVENYICVDGDHFCLGGISMRCADGTFCETQPAWMRADASPCVSAYPSDREAREECDEGWRWHEEDQCCVQLAQPCNAGFEWRHDEGCCRKVAAEIEIEIKEKVEEHPAPKHPEPKHEPKHPDPKHEPKHPEPKHEPTHPEPKHEPKHPEPKPEAKHPEPKHEPKHPEPKHVPKHPEEKIEVHVEVEEKVEVHHPEPEHKPEAKHPEAKVEGAEIVVLEEVHDCEGWGCEHEEPAEGWKYAECEGKEGCHVATADACVLPNYHCVDGLSFCLGDKVMACAAGTVCSTRAYTSFNISPCVHPWQAK